MREIWPALPIVIFSEDMQSRDVTNVIATLKHHNRVCKVYYRNEGLPNSLLKAFAAVDEPLPALTNLRLSFFHVSVLPDSFLGGSAPRLRSLDLDGIAYPSIGKLFSSTTNLVRLSLRRIPYSGYIAPQTITLLSMLSKLELLRLGFQHPRPQARRTSLPLPPSLV